MDSGENKQDEILSQIQKLPRDIILTLLEAQGQPHDPSQLSMINARGSWSPEEDDLLKTGIKQFGPKKWSDVARFVPTRTAKQCRERWFNRLSPELKHGPFEAWEDKIILEKQKDIGKKWSVIAQLLPGRSPGAIKNRWYSGLKTMSAQIDDGQQMMYPRDPGESLLTTEL